MKNEYLIRNQTLTTLAQFLNKIFGAKRSGKEFTPADVQQYIKKGGLPEYLGGNSIELEPGIESVKLYRIRK